MSEATKNSPSPMPTTTGGPLRAATMILSGSSAGHQHDGKQAAQVPQRAPDGGLEPVASHLALDQVRDDLGVGFGDEPVALALQRRLEIEVVLDDAVVDDDDAARAVAVRMRVLFGGPAVRGPSCVAQAVLAVDRVGGEDLLEPRQLARASPHVETAVAHQRDAGRVVAAVFEPPQAVDQDGQDGPGADVADDAAHALVISREPCQLLTVSRQP